MDFLEKGVALNYITVKPQNGPSAYYRPTRHRNGPNSREYTPRQLELYFAKSESMDICTNMVDYVVFRNEEREPVANYTIAMDGSPQYLSNIAHISNMIPHWHERVRYDNEGKPYRFQDGEKKGQLVYADYGMFKRGWPCRESERESLVNICNDLEVEDAIANPFRLVKYPVENGNLLQKFIEERKKWYMRVLKLKADQALVKVLHEIKIFLSKDVEEGEFDPLNVTEDLEGLVQEPNNEVVEEDLTETYRYFKKFRDELVYVFPMQTSHKCKYATGTHIKHLRAREAPEAKDFWVANTAKLTNCTSGQLLEGYYTPEEEAEIAQYEKHAMFHPASNSSNHTDVTDFVRRGLYVWHPPATPSESSDEFDFEMDDYEYDWDAEVNTLGEMANAARPQVSHFLRVF